MMKNIETDLERMLSIIIDATIVIFKKYNEIMYLENVTYTYTYIWVYIWVTKWVNRTR